MKRRLRSPKPEPSVKLNERLIWSASGSNRSERRRRRIGGNWSEVEVELVSDDPNPQPLRQARQHLLVHPRFSHPKLVDGETNSPLNKLVVLLPLLPMVVPPPLVRPLLPLPPPKPTSRLLLRIGAKNGKEAWVVGVEEVLVELLVLEEVPRLVVLEAVPGGSSGFFSFVDLVAIYARSEFPMITTSVSSHKC